MSALPVILVRALFRAALIATSKTKAIESREDEFVNYVKGANLAGFIKVADAMLAYGCV